jgi:hypothetical protein
LQGIDWHSFAAATIGNKTSVMKTITTALSGLILTGTLLFAPIALRAQNDASQAPRITKGYKFDNGNQTLKRDYVDRILQAKMGLLKKDLAVLVDKKKRNYAAYVDSAMALFNDDETKMVTVSNKNTGKVTVKTVKAYLTDVAKLPYRSVDVTYRNYTAINNIRKQPDGTYRGMVVLEQEFTGFDKEGGALYHDVVRRNIEVDIRIREYPRPGYHLTALHLFFGNMGVSEVTTSL